MSNHFLSVYILPGTFLFSLSNCHVFLFSVTRKRNLTDRTGRPAACRVDIGTLPVPLYFSSFPSRMTGAQTYPASDVTRDSQWCLPLTYSISRLLPVCYVWLHTVPCPGSLGTTLFTCASLLETLRESTVFRPPIRHPIMSIRPTMGISMTSWHIMIFRGVYHIHGVAHGMQNTAWYGVTSAYSSIYVWLAP